jgi:CHASE2 domain-containing sensor protein
MAIRVEHELHRRRQGRNLGVGLILLGLAAIVFGLTVVKVLQLGDAGAFQAYDHVLRPAMIPAEGAE